MRVIYSDQKIPADLKEGHSIFLAGPTPRSLDVYSWRPEAVALLGHLGYDGTVLVPEHEVPKEKADYIDQVEWEYEGLENVTCIAFWVPRDLKTMPAFTTNVEFGSYIRSARSVYGRPPNAPKTRYLDWLYEKTRGLKPEESICDLMMKARWWQG